MTEDILESLACQLDRTMRRQRLRQHVLAERTGLSRMTVSRVLRARDTRISTIATIANALGVQVQITLVSSLTR